MEASTRTTGNGAAIYAGQRVREELESIRPLISREGSRELLTRVAERISQADPILQDACDTHARVTRAKLIEVCRIPLELKGEIDKKLEHRRTHKPGGKG